MTLQFRAGIMFALLMTTALMRRHQIAQTQGSAPLDPPAHHASVSAVQSSEADEPQSDYIIQPAPPAPANLTVGYFGGSLQVGSDHAFCIVYVSKDHGKFWLQGVITNLETGRHFGIQGSYSPRLHSAELEFDPHYSDGTAFKDAKFESRTPIAVFVPEQGVMTIYADDKAEDTAKGRITQMLFLAAKKDALLKEMKEVEEAYHLTLTLPQERSDSDGKSRPTIAGASANPAPNATPPAPANPAPNAIPPPSTANPAAPGVSTTTPVDSDSWALVSEELMNRTADHRTYPPYLNGEFTGTVGFFTPHHVREIDRVHDQHNNGTFYRSQDFTYDVSFSPAPPVLKRGVIYTFTAQVTADIPIATNRGGTDAGWRWGPLKVISATSSNGDTPHAGLWAGRDDAGLVPFCRQTINVRLDSAPDEFQVEEACQSAAAQGKATLIRYTYRRHAVPVRANQTWGGASFVARQGTTSYCPKGGTYQNLPNLDNVGGLGIGDRAKTGPNGQLVLRTTSGALVAIEPNSEIEILDGGMVNVLSGKKTIISGPGP